MSEANPMAAALAGQISSPSITAKGCGFSCWQYHGNRGWGGCRNSIEFDDIDGFEDHTNGRPLVEVRAGMAGWCIGHFEGQAHIVCPDDRGSVWDASPLGYDEDVIAAVESIARTFADGE